ncbi:MAG: hypothetical protein AB7E82_09770 [Cyclobacteriaceae bacterium]
MFIIYLFSGLILLIVGWVIFVPVNIEVNVSDRYILITQPVSFSMSMYPTVSPWMQLHIMGIRVQSPSPAAKEKQETKPQKQKPGLSRSRKAWFGLVRSAARSLHLKSLWLNIDTGDVMANAKLFPFAWLASNLHEKATIQINFVGKVEGCLKASISLYVLIAAFILFLTSK